jgi:broad specificity phosphatase PhoE
MSSLILVRHSRVAPESTGPDTDWPLSSEGRELCIALADALQPFQPELLLSSTMRRARETANLAAIRLDIPWRTVGGIEEHHRPFVPEGQRRQEDFDASMQRFFDSPGERVFGEESAEEARERFAAAVEALLAQQINRNLALVSHGTVIALFAAPFFGLEPIDLWRRIDWPSFIVIDIEERRGLNIVDSISKL